MSADAKPVPTAGGKVGLAVLWGVLRERTLLSALRIMRDSIGDIFRIPLPGFSPVVVTGPGYVKEVLLTNRDAFDWRPVGDPVTKLLRNGVLVVDGQFHDKLREVMDPTVSRTFARDSTEEFIQQTRIISDHWEDGQTYDMLDEMRKVALLILVKTVFGVDMLADMDRLFDPIVKVIRYISPGMWIVLPDLPRPRYQEAIDTINEYLYSLIDDRRRQLEKNPEAVDNDLLTALIADSSLDDEVIKDQLLTMLIAGHDTSTALLAWTLYLITQYPQVQNRLRVELDESGMDNDYTRENLGQLTYLDSVIKESLRLFPPIHVGNRITNRDTKLGDYHIAAGTRLMYSIYLTHRDPAYWAQPDEFNPDRFDTARGNPVPSYAYIPFGAGPRMCIGAGFAQVESKVVLAYLLKSYSFELMDADVHMHMGATLEPHPGVRLRVHRREMAG
jgi:cytochrome P450